MSHSDEKRTNVVPVKGQAPCEAEAAAVRQRGQADAVGRIDDERAGAEDEEVLVGRRVADY